VTLTGLGRSGGVIGAARPGQRIAPLAPPRARIAVDDLLP
jgi:hypothetical protein